MGINRATDYSIRALVYMAINSSVEIISKAEICRTQGITPGFLTKIMQPLIKAGIVNSFRGVKGGFQLARNPNEVSIYEVISIIDDLFLVNVCLADNAEDVCGREKSCYMHTVWQEARESFQNVLKKYTLADVARQQVILLSMMAEKS